MANNSLCGNFTWNLFLIPKLVLRLVHGTEPHLILFAARHGLGYQEHLTSLLPSVSITCPNSISQLFIHFLLLLMWFNLNLQETAVSLPSSLMLQESLLSVVSYTPLWILGKFTYYFLVMLYRSDMNS